MAGRGTIGARLGQRWSAASAALALVLAQIPAPARAAAPAPAGSSGSEPAPRPSGPEGAASPRDEPPPVSGPVVVETGGMPPELAAPPVSALGEARRLEAAQRFAEAARIFEDQWRATADPRFLYHAAALRSRAGQHALALRQLDECLRAFIERGQLPDAVRRHLEDARQREIAATIPVRIQLVEPTLGGLQPVPAATSERARVAARPAGSPGGHVPKDMFEVAGAGGAELRLDPGGWFVRVEVPGFVPVEAVRQVEAGPTAWEVVVQRRRVFVDLRFAPESAVRRARLRLRASDHDSRLALEKKLSGPTTTVTLTPGPWRLEVEARRHEAVMDLTIAPDQPAIAVNLYRSAIPHDQRLSRDKKVVLGILGAFSVMYFTGIGLILGGTNREGRAEKRDAEAYTAAGLDPKVPGTIDPAAAAMIEAAYPAAQLHDDVEAAKRLHTAGIVVAAGAIGTAAAVAPLAAGARRRVAWIELGVGAAVAGGGAGWLAWSLGQRALLLDEPAGRLTGKQLDRGDGHRIAASMFTGIGLGMVVFSAVVLATDAAARRKRARSFGAAPLAAPGLAGLSLRGRF